MSLTLVNALLEANVLDVARETLREGQIPGLRFRRVVVVGHDRAAGLALVAGWGDLSVGLQWIAAHRARDLPNFKDALDVVFPGEEVN